ncbi:hypothetical protein Trydic_g15180 [Trypoxylus dichotomus]
MGDRTCIQTTLKPRHPSASSRANEAEHPCKRQPMLKPRRPSASKCVCEDSGYTGSEEVVKEREPTLATTTT